MKFRLFAALICLTLISTAMAQGTDDDARQFEGTTLNFLYFPISFVGGLEDMVPEFEELTGINVEFELLDE